MIDFDSPDVENELRRIGAKWIERIRDAEKREKDWMDAAEEAENAYAAYEDADVTGEKPTFNIIHSNIETIVPAIINSPPSPDIRPRHDNPDKKHTFIAQVIERGLSTQIDDGALFSEAEDQAQDAMLAGRGIVRVKLDADVEQVPVEVLTVDEMTGEPIILQEMQDRIANERLVWENVSWRDYREGPAKRWSDVPWVAFRHEVDEEEQDRLTDEQIKALEADLAQKDEDNKDGDLTIWEIWCKRTRTVYFVTETNKVLSVQPDPLGLQDFFPMDEPVQPIGVTGKRTPVCPYSVYKEQAHELDKVSKRINKIVGGLRLRGIFAGNSGDVLDLVDLDDWQLKPVDDLKGLVAQGGIDNAIQWMPVDQAIQILRELLQARESIKATIYEITGISDIVRGASRTSETATAQEIKSRWGSLRIRKMQRAMEGAMRDCLRIGAEIMWAHFQPPTMARVAGINEDQGVLAQLMQEPLDLYRIDVESDSTIRADLTARREEMGQFLQGTASYFQTMAPLVEQAPEVAGPLIDLYAAFGRQYNLGQQAEQALDQLVELAKQAATQPRPDPAAEQAQFERAVKEKELSQKDRDLDIKAAGVAVKADEQDLKEASEEVNALLKVNELHMERDQERPVAIGGA